MQELRKFPVVV